VLEATTPVGAPVATAGALGIGNDLSNGGFAGQVDEVQVSNVARLLAWIQTEYNNQNSPSTFYSVGAENASGVVIGGDQSGRVYSVDTATWTTTWTANLSASADFIQATPAAQLRAYANAAFQAAHPDDVIFVASRNAGDTNCGLNSSSTNNKVFALLASDGSVRWTFNGACTDGQVDWIVGMPYVDYARNRLYVTSRAGAAGTQTSLWVIDTLTGALVTPPSPLTLGHSEASPTLSWDGSTIYVGNLAGTLYAVDATTLAVKWSLSVGAAVKGFVWEDYSIPGRLYFSTGSDVRCVQDNGASGSACAGWTVSAIAGSSTLLLLDKIYVGSSDGKLHQIVPTGINAGVDEKQFPAATTLDGTTVGDVSTETGTEVFVGTAAGKLYKIPLPLP
jgi:outer membrane protein assembly factor BamB